MNPWLIYSIGFLAQILFSSRLLIQWITSEKEQRVITPTIFWILSLFASILLFIYGYLRDDFSIMLGQFLTYYIYIRNLQLQHQWHKFSKLCRWIVLCLPIIIIGLYFINNSVNTDVLFKNEAIPFWLLSLGVIAQLVFTLRFVYQWLYSEVKKASTLPFGFWLLSLTGAILIIIYAVLRVDWVLIIGHSFGSVIYIRNMYLIKNQN